MIGPRRKPAAGRSSKILSMLDDQALSALRSVLADPNLRFPRFPALLADICVFSMPDQLGVQIRGAGEPVLLVGQHAESCVLYLQREMNGSRSIDNLLSSCPDHIPPVALARALYTLYSNGLLRHGPATYSESGLRSSLTRQALYWERYLNITGYNESSDEVASRLSAVTIVIVGEGLFGAAVVRLLRELGVSSVRGVAVRDNDAFADVGASFSSFATVPKSQLHRWRHTLVDVCSNADVAIVALRNASADFLNHLNKTFLGLKLPYLVGNESAEAYEIGPFVLPYKTGCYECMIKRLTSMSAMPIEEELYQRHLQAHSDSEAFLKGESIAGSCVAAGLLVNDMSKFATRVGTSSLVESVMQFRPMTGEVSTNRFIRVPHCESCSKLDSLKTRQVHSSEA